jgi:hypothetical protein
MAKALAIEPSTKPQQQPADSGPDGLQEEIKLRAYELYEERGRIDGHHEDDWDKAEQEIRHRGQIHRAA